MRVCIFCEKLEHLTRAQVANAFWMVVIGMAMGALFKGSRSAWGPIIFWTLVNGTSA